MGNSEKHETGDRLRQIAKQMYDGNQSNLARALGMKPPSFSKYVQGNRRPGAAVLERLSRLGVNLHWFLTGEGSVARSTSSSAQPLSVVREETPSEIEGPDGSLHRISLVSVTENEDGDPYIEEIGTADWLEGAVIERTYGVPPNRLMDFRISGDAMADTILPGDWVRGTPWRGGGLVDSAVYLFYTDSGLLVRRVRMGTDELRLTAENSAVSDLTFDADAWSDQLRPVAHLLQVIRSL